MELENRALILVCGMFCCVYVGM
uniref:Uncharacterized protein n=1 Tax=Rhizophora mucronata TaxID=61149 RepID=A0A2P2J832_RHIMU